MRLAAGGSPSAKLAVNSATPGRWFGTRRSRLPIRPARVGPSPGRAGEFSPIRGRRAYQGRQPADIRPTTRLQKARLSALTTGRPLGGGHCGRRERASQGLRGRGNETVEAAATDRAQLPALRVGASTSGRVARREDTALLHRHLASVHLLAGGRSVGAALRRLGDGPDATLPRPTAGAEWLMSRPQAKRLGTGQRCTHGCPAN